MLDITLKGKTIIKGKIVTETALHIGGTRAGVDIGGVDNPVIKDQDGKPYIPGSSLKGKIRSILEKSEGLATGAQRVWQKKNEISLHLCNESDCDVSNKY